jgi:hypothetical protein
MTREEFVKSMDAIAEEINDFNQQLSTVSGMLAVLRQSTKETDLAMHSLISLIEENVNEVINKRTSKIKGNILRIVVESASMETKVVKPRKPRSTTQSKPRQTRKKKEEIVEKPVEKVVETKDAE